MKRADSNEIDETDLPSADTVQDTQDAQDESGPADVQPNIEQELSTLNDRHLRLAAEFDNYRKRTERERRETSVRSQGELAAVLLDALDDLERVVEVDAEASSAETILEGVRLVERKLMRALESAGLERIDAAGESFDPESMEALMTTPADDPADDHQVDQVFQAGYRFKGQLLRPARVRVKQYGG